MYWQQCLKTQELVNENLVNENLAKLVNWYSASHMAALDSGAKAYPIIDGILNTKIRLCRWPPKISVLTCVACVSYSDAACRLVVTMN